MGWQTLEDIFDIGIPKVLWSGAAVKGTIVNNGVIKQRAKRINLGSLQQVALVIELTTSSTPQKVLLWIFPMADQTYCRKV